jgi:hypothetical protein
MSSTEFLRHAGRFIDPEDCGSGVNWRMKVEMEPPRFKDGKKQYDGYVRTEGSIALSDCGHVIHWAVGGDDVASIDKIDNAIAELQACRRALVQAVKVCERLKIKHNIKDDE